MGKLFGEPVMVICAGGTVLVEALIHLWNAFATAHVLTEVQEHALMGVAALVLPLLARRQVTPTAGAPPAVDLAKVGLP